MKIISIGVSLAFFTTSLIFVAPAKAGIFDSVFGRCGAKGEGKVTVTNNLQTTVYVLTDKDDASGGPDGKELAPGESNETPICNRNGFRAKVYTAENCGKTFLSESRFDRVYNEEHVTINPDGFSFSVGNILDAGSRVAGVAVTYLAAGYGIPPQALAAMGVNEANVTGACTTGPSECAKALYEYRNKLPSDLFTTINADKCLAKAFSSASERGQTANNQTCVSVDSRRGWQKFNFPNNFNKVVSITGGWTVDAATYGLVGATGHTGSDAERLAPYNAYKYDQEFPFGALLVDIPPNGYRWIANPKDLPRSITNTTMRINDTTFGDNAGSLNVCFGN